MTRQMADSYLEEISEQIRMDEPVSFLDAIAAIDYQRQLQADRAEKRRKTFWYRTLLFLRMVKA